MLHDCEAVIRDAGRDGAYHAPVVDEAGSQAMAGTGGLYERTDEGLGAFLGSCFSFVEPTVFVCAAHCVREHPPETLCINHFGGVVPKLISQVQEVALIENADLAVLKTESGPTVERARPFKRAKAVAHYGTEVCASGFPEGLMSEGCQNPFRFFRGNIQRPFAFSGLGNGGDMYSAWELSFACPPGLSGGPLFLARDPSTVIGVMTNNFETYTTKHVEEVEVSGDETKRLEARSVITYGVAANILHAFNALETALGRDVPKGHLPSCP